MMLQVTDSAFYNYDAIVSVRIFETPLTAEIRLAEDTMTHSLTPDDLELIQKQLACRVETEKTMDAATRAMSMMKDALNPSGMTKLKKVGDVISDAEINDFKIWAEAQGLHAPESIELFKEGVMPDEYYAAFYRERDLT